MPIWAAALSSSRDELDAFRKLAATMLSLDDDGLAAATQNGTITEIDCNE